MPRLLDLFCGAGGCSVGYTEAGYDVTGVDINPQPRYPYEFHRADAFTYLAAHSHQYDIIHASPPCQGYSTITADHTRHPRLIPQVRRALQATRKPYIIENVPGAARHMINPVMLCGSVFALPIRRHRLFETPVWILSPPCTHSRQTPIGIYGDHPDPTEFRRPDGTGRGRKAATLAEARQAMGIHWMTWKELTEAIPPAYTKYIGTQILEHTRIEATK